ncbi:hypothetical protein [Chitinophaga defluvii]|uniref:Uncharacterized protein n=1 Tax=Chitinophaga defluvii TaxID=3163343 RepID=A0ABV2T9W2_9BACT
MSAHHKYFSQQPGPNPMTPGKEQPEPEIKPVPAKPEQPEIPEQPGTPEQPKIPDEVPERDIKRTPPNPQAEPGAGRQ